MAHNTSAKSPLSYDDTHDIIYSNHYSIAYSIIWTISSIINSLRDPPDLHILTLRNNPPLPSLSYTASREY